VADVLAAREAAAPREVAHLTLRLDNAAGGEDRIRIDVRRDGAGPSGVNARIDVADLGAAGRLAARAGELRDALARHGLATDAVQVSGAAPATLHAAGAPERAAGGESGNAGGGGSSSQQQPDGRDHLGRDHLGRDAGGRGDSRHRNPRAPDAWLDDEFSAVRRAR
jgi:hypothetical protein